MIMAGHDIEGKVVMHICDNPACFRYDHLRVGTQIDNIHDMFAKGRGRKPAPIKHGTYAGVQRHYKDHTPLCHECIEASRDYSRKRVRK